MHAPKYQVSVQFDRVSWSHTWDSAEPLRLGYALPWTIERRDEAIIITDKAGNAGEVPDVVINQAAPIDLASAFTNPEHTVPGQRPVIFKIMPLMAIEPVYQPTVGERGRRASDRDEFRVFICCGDLVVHSQILGRTFDAQGAFGRLFRLTRRGQTFRLKSNTRRITINDQKGATDVSFSPEQMASASVKIGSLSWYFKRIGVRDISQVPVVYAPEDTTDNRWFKAYLGVVSAAAILFFMALPFLSSLFESKKKEEPKPQFAKIVIKKKKPKTGNRTQAEVSRSPGKKQKRPQRRQPRPQPRSVAKAPPPVASKRVPQKKVSAAVLRAKALQNSMSNLLRAGSPSLLAKSKIAGTTRRAPTAKNRRFASTTPSVGAMSKQNVGVDASRGSGGTYSKAGKGGVSASQGGGFVAVGGFEGEGGEGMIQGGLTKKEVFEAINKHINEVRFCYESALVRKPGLEGKLMVRFVISGSGRVRTSRVKETTLADTGVNDCILRRLAKWKFPKPKGGADVTVSYPFMFRRM